MDEEKLDISSSSTLVDNGNLTSALTKSLARRETRVVNILRASVLAVLLMTGVLVSTVMYVVTREQEKEHFSIAFQHSADQVIASFHSAVERNLAAAAALSSSITSYAKDSNQDFPFVTLPDMEVLGADLRAQSGSRYVMWCPLVDDDNRDDWEAHALDHRNHWTESYELETEFLVQQSEQYGYPAKNFTDPSFQLPQIPTLTTLDDGTNFHPKIWSNGGNGLSPPGDEAEGGGPYLPIWQQSPMPSSSHQYINANIAGVKLMRSRSLQTMSAEKKAIMQHALPTLEAYRGYFDSILKRSQYRQDFDDLRDNLHTMMTYPVFNSFEEDREMAGILVSGIHWKSLFSNLLPSNVEGIIVVVSNSLNDTFAYRVDGDQATEIGVGDPRDSYRQYESMGIATNVNSHLEQRAGPESRAFKTVGLSDSVQYDIRVYPSDDTADAFLTDMPGNYTAVTLCVFIFASSLFLVYSCVVEQRQGVMTERVIEAVNRAADTERELNEFLSHEIRNPLSAAILASTFVSTAVNEEEPLKDEETRKHARRDIEVVNSSLHFINDFLRSMLDIYRATGNKITVDMAPTDILQDILEPVASTLNKRLFNFEVIVECPANLVVMTDSIRLKQVILNLVRNATKFVEKGFLRMRAEVVNTQVIIYVEDSGPGICPQKQKELFIKYQESLDLLSQGTGIGLNLAKKLTQIMKGDLWLDGSYDSGIEGSPGARFVVELRTGPIDIESALPPDTHDACHAVPVHPDSTIDAVHPQPDSQETAPPKSFSTQVKDNQPKVPEKTEPTVKTPVISEDIHLPEGVSVLFVDDDVMLRKLFVRAVKRTAPPSWCIQEASSGEVALELCEGRKYDLIFMDQYMASANKQLLGTEATVALRTKGVEAVICGLSANDLRDAFVNAGANDFILKPMPCKPAELKKILLRMLKASSRLQ